MGVYRRGFSVDPYCHVVGGSGIIVVVAATVLISPIEKRVASRGVARSVSRRSNSSGDVCFEFGNYYYLFGR